MDQSQLVTDPINNGSKFANEFTKKFTLQSVFWLKESAEGDWLLYLASDEIDDTNFDVAYKEMHRILSQEPLIRLDRFQVRVAGLDHSVVKAVLDIQQTNPDALPRLIRNQMLGGRFIDEAFLYALPEPAAN